jgi:hypothetical protein
LGQGGDTARLKGFLKKKEKSWVKVETCAEALVFLLEDRRHVEPKR